MRQAKSLPNRIITNWTLKIAESRTYQVGILRSRKRRKCAVFLQRVHIHTIIFNAMAHWKSLCDRCSQAIVCIQNKQLPFCHFGTWQLCPLPRNTATSSPCPLTWAMRGICAREDECNRAGEHVGPSSLVTPCKQATPLSSWATLC